MRISRVDTMMRIGIPHVPNHHEKRRHSRDCKGVVVAFYFLFRLAKKETLWWLVCRFLDLRFIDQHVLVVRILHHHVHNKPAEKMRRLDY